ncbi:MAG TPA: GNAT family N-acetyltransferase [Candidatus Thermoplasmatota archaeon]|nr:GNAT family N-acetyltransferase [Candidatus Thermoplasmatota archaeon]
MPIKYRHMRASDIHAVQALEAAAFPGIPPDKYWKDEMLEAHVRIFPEGQFVAEIDGWIVGSATSLRVPLARALTPHKWTEITGGGYLTTHDPNGDAIYLTEIMVHPDARRSGVAKRLYQMRKDLARSLNVRALVSGGRIPGYDKYADRMSAVEYVKSVLAGDRGDRTLSAQLSAGFSVAAVMENYITDPKSRNHATLILWWNLDWRP